MTPGNAFRNAHGHFDRPAALFRSGLQAAPNFAQERGQIPSVLPLRPTTEIQRMSQPVQFDPIEVPAVKELLNYAEFQAPDTRMLKIQCTPPVKIIHQP